MSQLEQTIREMVREEVRRLVRSDAIAAVNDADAEDEVELRSRARVVASKFRRARAG